MLKRIALSLAFTLLAAAPALATNYITPANLKKMLDEKQEVILVDIQPADQFEKHHLPGAIETNAFPTKSDEEKARLDKTLPTINASKAPVTVLCPRGKSGAKNSYDYLQSKGVDEKRLQILEGGIADWPYAEMFVKGR
ncbi:MAG: rhodanese-like domain-containing protein [Desulfobulbaceae bacterium]|nr:rhodanese-like domain-containing protein [Desulfobulbaceae bacterium]HIJ90469.1 rhodanese-like domain-containing protein [Deltaproteobacteria bacterium]